MIYRIPLVSLITLALLSVTPLAALAANTSSAATESKLSKSSDATVNVNGGDLLLSSTGSFAFDPITVDEISSKLTSSKATATPQLTISDYRGNHAGWSLSVALSNFIEKDNNGNQLSAELDLSKSIKGDTVTIDQTTGSTITISSQQAGNPSTQLVWKTDQHNHGEGTNTTSFDGSTLKIHKNPKVSSGNYTATLTWNLQSGQQALTAAQ